jgi:hypothetical protein
VGACSLLTKPSRQRRYHVKCIGQVAEYNIVLINRLKKAFGHFFGRPALDLLADKPYDDRLGKCAYLDSGLAAAGVLKPPRPVTTKSGLAPC